MLSLCTIANFLGSQPQDKHNASLNSKYVLDKAIKMLDFDPIAALNNFKKTADIGDSTKIQLNNGKVAIVQKEANGWYASIGNERVKGTFKIIEGFLKSQNDNY